MTTTEPDWYAEDFDSWGNPDDWPPDWHIKAKAAMIRHFSRIDLAVDKLSDGWHVRIPGKGTWMASGKSCRILETTAYLDGFLEACEAMASQWDCRVKAV